ncbi:TPA: YaiO family outer membrane beta-barrel protein [Escherichia coli]|uniref:YaiO family outer membrane beta-barrel protein n=1 Tax=Escherichia coli TaxID=562 RepID=UPI000E1D63F6|nr:YaiO family outer membrane beta-barrel protein [Escherichia coli]EFN8783522.1 YaiO family outer membrane beta-barrel protein [Escherichia coli]EHS0425047.1 YaiO family outer membrane beta-barrel protein [Escherichia coli]HBA9677358.1 YaiO family outer membrane beta-barrel protein [Escherichia coli]HBB0203967.1 YaiO family outer membrane beta-barrel protein [Escherichia coli]
MIKQISLFMFFFSILPAYAELKSISAGYDFVDYSGDKGSRKQTYAEIVANVEKSTLLLNISHGRRIYENESFNAVRGQGVVWYKWNEWMTTRTGISFADNSPVFAPQDFRQDVNVNVLPKTVFSTGYRHTKYYSDNRVNSWHAGISLYTGPLITNYRYIHYNSGHTGNSYGNLLSFRLRDSNNNGYTQIWIGYGTSAYHYDWMPVTLYGRTKSVNLQRIQPLNSDISLGLSVGQTWYNTPTHDYRGLQLASNLIWKF